MKGLLLKVDLHVHPLGHGPLPEDAHNINFRGPHAESVAERYRLPGQDAIVRAVTGMVDAAKARGLDGIANTDHLLNTSPLAHAISERRKGPIIIPGFEAAPISVRPALNHVLVVGVPPFPGQTPMGFTLQGLRAMAEKHNGLLIAAHPRSRFFWERSHILNTYAAIEGRNGGFPGEEWHRGGLPRVAGSDAHEVETMLARCEYTEVDADERSAASILDAVRHGRVRVRCDG